MKNKTGDTDQLDLRSNNSSKSFQSLSPVVWSMKNKRILGYLFLHYPVANPCAYKGVIRKHMVGFYI
jgi:hypothetical protein